MRQPKKILIVEDNVKNMRLIKMLLHHHHCLLLEATNGREALDVVAREEPDLIIMDIQLPEISGIEAIKRLKKSQKWNKIPIIAISAYAMQEEKEEILATGCSLYISKPINIHLLQEAVASLLPNEAA